MLRKKQPANAQGLRAGLEGGTTLIAHNTRVRGDLMFEEQLYINGIIEGDVSAEAPDGSVPEAAALVVCEGGQVIGEIRAPNVVIDGTVHGDVYATGKLELAAKAKVMGNVHYNLVEMQLGSVVNGQMVSLTDAEGQPVSAESALAEAEAEAGSEAGLTESAEQRAERERQQKMREAVGDVVTGIR